MMERNRMWWAGNIMDFIPTHTTGNNTTNYNLKITNEGLWNTAAENEFLKLGFLLQY